MPMCVRPRVCVSMKMQVATPSDQLVPDPEAKNDHKHTDRALRASRESDRHRMAEKEKAAADREQHDAMPQCPTESRTRAFRTAASLRGEDGEGHHMVGIERVNESQTKAKCKPGDGFDVQPTAPLRSGDHVADASIALHPATRRGTQPMTQPLG